MQPAAIPVVSASPFPAVVFIGGRPGIQAACPDRGIAQNVLHIAPAETGIGLQHQRDHAGGDRRGRRRAAKRIGVVAIQKAVIAIAVAQTVCRDRPGGSRYQQMSAIGGVVSNLSVCIQSTDCHRETASVKRLAIAVNVAVAGRFDVDGSQTTASVLGRFFKFGDIAIDVETRRAAIAVIGDIKVAQIIQRLEIS